MAAISPGLTVQDGFVHWAMDRWILNPFSASLLNMIMPDGPYSNGNAVIKHPEDGAKEGSIFIKNHIIRVTEKAFDDFAGTGSNEAFNRSVLGIK